VAIVTVVPLDESVMQVRVRTETRAGGGEPRSAVVQVTLHYAIVPPRTEAEIIRNPIGLYVTRFSLAEELS
jgi:type IV secretory pathway TrbF-like protein